MTKENAVTFLISLIRAVEGQNDIDIKEGNDERTDGEV